MNDFCRSQNVGYISSQNFGPWGFAFTDFGKEHIVTDEDGEQTRSFIVTMIEKGEKTVVQPMRIKDTFSNMEIMSSFRRLKVWSKLMIESLSK